MKITNIKVYGENHIFKLGEIHISDGKFVLPEQDNDSNNVIDGEGAYAIPGLIDIHFHGCVGEDISDASLEGLQRIADYEASIGVTSICPATMTMPEEELHSIMATVREYIRTDKARSGAKLVGINMEGPFISPKKNGAQAVENIIPCDVELFRKLQKESAGLIKLVDIAPEITGAMDFIRQVKDEVVVSIAHTMADYDTAMEAFELGASHVTHLYNAMPPFNHRNPGVIGAAADYDKCQVELICDGVHIHPSVVRATYAMFGGERVILISDSMRGTGLQDGSYTLGGQKVNKNGQRATLLDGTIAGSVTNLMDCLVTAVRQMHIPLEVAVASATENPARRIGIFDNCGSISIGKAADLVLLRPGLSLQKVFLKGTTSCAPSQPGTVPQSSQ
jgi:N-acetylglucosamine-6-phosphate deacetylase